MRSNIFDFYFDKEFSKLFCGLEKDWEIVDVSDSSKAIVVKAIGIDEGDIDIKIKKIEGVDFLTINGETIDDLTDKKYSLNLRFEINANRIDGIDWKMKNGLLKIYINFKKDINRDIKINKL